jgi:hypothetical protein
MLINKSEGPEKMLCAVLGSVYERAQKLAAEGQLIGKGFRCGKVATNPVDKTSLVILTSRKSQKVYPESSPLESKEELLLSVSRQKIRTDGRPGPCFLSFVVLLAESF